jgi:hypothetical protein
MEDDMENPLTKKPRKKRMKQYKYKDVFDKTPYPEKKITIVKNKKKID